jgi:outer membrane lipoprotein-sorting protein
MTNRNEELWEALSMGLVDEQTAEKLRAAAGTDAEQRAAARAAQKTHHALIRTYEAFDQQHDALRQQLLAALPAVPPESASRTGRRRIGASVMNILFSRRTAAILAPAACLLIGAIVFFNWTGQIALARVVETLREVRTIVCTLETRLTGGALEQESEGTLYLSVDGGTRFEMRVNGEPFSTLYSAGDDTSTLVMPPQHIYMVIRRDRAAPAAPDHAPAQWLNSLRRLTADADRRLGREVVDGRVAEGFEIAASKLGYTGAAAADQPPPTARLWVDVESRLPVRYEVSIAGPEPGSQIQVAHTGFRFDEPLAPEFFRPQIPDDYQRVEVTMPPPNEATLLAGLKLFADLAGEYPEQLDATFIVGRFAGALAAKAAMSGEAPGVEALVGAAANQSMTLAAGCQYFAQLVRDGRQPEYFGSDVEPGDAKAVLLRWRLPNGQTRLVYGDLRTETAP